MNIERGEIMKERVLEEQIKRLNQEISILRRYIYHLQQVVMEIINIDIAEVGKEDE